MAWTRASAGLGVAVLLCVGCQAPRGPAEVKSTDPDLKIVAIRRDVCDKNVTDVPLLVEGLSSEDAAVRFYSIQGLRRLTGDEFGYVFYADEGARKPAVAVWQDWLDRGGYTRLKRAD